MIKFLRVNNKKKLNTTSLLVPELIKSKIYLGLDKTILNSNSRGYLKGIRNKIYVFNALQIAKNLQRALRVIYNSHSSKLVVTNNHRLKMEPTKRILFLGFPETKKIEWEAFCQSKNQFYVFDEEWINGLLTNHESLFEYKRDFLKNLEFKNKGEIDVFHQNFRGILKLNMIPDLIVIYDHSQNYYAFMEAKRLKIPTISFLNASDNPSDVDYPVLGNFSSLVAGDLFYYLIKKTLKESVCF